mgnify:CR=1 FL=1
MLPRRISSHFLSSNDTAPRVQVAGDGDECVEMVQRQRFEVILMDCQMPRMNGFEATRAIRRLEAQGLISAAQPTTNERSHNAPIAAEEEAEEERKGEEAEVTRSRSGRRSLLIVVLTASATAEVRQKCSESGMDNCLQKPFRKEVLIQILKGSGRPGERWPRGRKEAG